MFHSRLHIEEPIPWFLWNDTDELGEYLGPIGDVNGDGVQDFYVGWGSGPTNSWQGVDVVLGGNNFATGGGADADERVLRFEPWRRDDYVETYFSATELGDVDGDGFDDFLLEIRDRSRNSQYRIIYGQAEMAADAPVRPDDFRNRQIQGPVSWAGDVNGDGLDDLIHESSILLGGTFDVVLVDATDSLRKIGDVNQDGFDDLVATDASESYVILGSTELPSRMDVSAMPRLQRPLGELVPDLNGDGFDDFISYERDNSRFVHFEVVLGAADLLSAEWAVVAFELPLEIHQAVNIEIGDWNGDGFGDLALFSPDTLGVPTIDVYFGSENLFSDEPSIQITGSCTDYACPKIAGSFDVNQDGIEDLLVGDPSVRPATAFGRAGAVYFILGRSPTHEVGEGAFSGSFAVSPKESVTLQVSGIATPMTRRRSHEIRLQLHADQFDVNPFTTRAELTAVEPLLGDLDQDGTVGLLDFITLSRNFGAPNATAKQGDLDGDAIVSFADFLILAQQFGR